jgi:hypothetical protein
MSVFFGSLTFLLGMVMVCVGLTRQIVKNRRERKCGMDVWFTAIVLSVYVSRMSYAMTIRSYYIVIPDAIGAILCGVLLYQFFKFKSNS